jgi:hypothetical protein
MNGVAFSLNVGADDGDTVINVRGLASSYLYVYDLSLEELGA